MTKTEVSKQSENITSVRFTVDSDQLKKEREVLAKVLNEKHPIAGFRPGHAPAELVREKHGEAEFDREIATTLIRQSIVDYLIAADINPVIDPGINIEKLDEELVFSATFTTRPEVKVGDYQKIKAKKPTPKDVKSEEAEKVIQNLYEKSGFSDTKVDPESGDKFILDSKGQKIALGQSKQGPLDDSFAKQFGLNTLAELKDKIKSNLEAEAVREAEVGYETAILESLVKMTKVDLPTTLIDAEVKAMISRLQSQVENLGGNFEEYLKNQKKTTEDLSKDFADSAKKTLTASLALDEIGRDQKINVTKEEIKAYMPENHDDHPGHEAEEENIRVQLVRREALAYLKKQVQG